MQIKPQKNPFSNSYLVRIALPTCILYMGLRYLWRHRYCEKCLKNDLEFLKSRGAIDFDEQAVADQQSFLTYFFPTNLKIKAFHFGDVNKIVKMKLVKKETCATNVRKFYLELPNKKYKHGVPIGQHVVFLAIINGKMVSRQYMPTKFDEKNGIIEFIIKMYVGGLMTGYLDSLDMQSYIDVCGPVGPLIYNGKGMFTITYPLNEEVFIKRAKKIGFIAGGSGIGPILIILRALHREGKEAPPTSLLYANKAEDDIIAKDLLNQFVLEHKFLEMALILQDPPPNWKGLVGTVTKEAVIQYMPKPDCETFIMICGPPPMLAPCVHCLLKAGHHYSRILAR